MNPSLKKYIDAGREKGHSDDQIKAELLKSGWEEAMVTAGLKGEEPMDEAPPPPPPSSTPQPKASEQITGTDDAVKVVSAKTTAGLEYSIMFLSLWIAAISLGAVLHSAVDKAYGNESVYTNTISFSSAALIVSFPIFAWLFLWLKKQEAAHPELRRDQNRRGAIQLSLIVTFIVGIGKLIFYVYQLLNTGNSDTEFASSTSDSVIGNTLHTLITLSIAGGIFGYYWNDEHRKQK
jgi:hypothetical protein